MTYGQDKHGVPKGLTEDAGFLGDQPQPLMLIILSSCCSHTHHHTRAISKCHSRCSNCHCNDTPFHQVCCVDAGYKNWLPFARTK